MTMLFAPQLSDQRFQVAFQTRSGSEQKGPLGVLWTLIESYEVDVFSVSLSRITADFLDYMTTMPISLEEQADFTQLAARLLFYKSRMLLPNAIITDDSPPDRLPYELVEQLLEYKKMQQAAEEMRRLEERAQLRLTREPQWSLYEIDADYLEVDLISFLRTFRDFLERQEKSRPMQIVDENVSVEEMMEYMLSRLIGSNEASFFRSVTGFSTAKIIACFLALLELAKERRIRLRQNNAADDIYFEPAGDDNQARLPFEDL